MVLNRKLITLFGKALKITLLLLAFPMVLAIRIIRPFLLIRFGKITSYILGHFVFDTEYYLSEKEYDKIKAFDFFFYHSKYELFKYPPNEQWDLMVRRHLWVHPFVEYLYKANAKLPGGLAHDVKVRVDNPGSRDLKGILSKTNNIYHSSSS